MVWVMDGMAGLVGIGRSRLASRIIAPDGGAPRKAEKPVGQ